MAREDRGGFLYHVTSAMIDVLVLSDTQKIPSICLGLCFSPCHSFHWYRLLSHGTNGDYKLPDHKGSNVVPLYASQCLLSLITGFHEPRTLATTDLLYPYTASPRAQRTLFQPVYSNPSSYFIPPSLIRSDRLAYFGWENVLTTVLWTVTSSSNYAAHVHSDPLSRFTISPTPRYRLTRAPYPALADLSHRYNGFFRSTRSLSTRPYFKTSAYLTGSQLTLTRLSCLHQFEEKLQRQPHNQ